MTERPNQKRRTRRALLDAAADLLREGQSPTLEEIAERALVSRATAYRYFPNVDNLLVEAALDVVSPQADALFVGHTSQDPVARLDRVDEALNAMPAAETPGKRTSVTKYDVAVRMSA